MNKFVFGDGYGVPGEVMKVRRPVGTRPSPGKNGVSVLSVFISMDSGVVLCKVRIFGRILDGTSPVPGRVVYPSMYHSEFRSLHLQKDQICLSIDKSQPIRSIEETLSRE